MIKAVLLLALIAMAAGAYYSWLNYDEIKTTTQDIADRDEEITVLDRSIDELNKELSDAEDDFEAERNRKLDNEEKVKLLSETKQQREREDQNLSVQIQDVAAEIQILRDKFDPDQSGMTPDELTTRIQDLQAEIEESKSVVTTLEGQLQTDRLNLSNRRKLLSGVVEQQQEFLAGIGRNALQATVSAVNDAYSFVVINVPRGSVIDSDQPLIVTRQGQRIARLRITSVEPTQVVANIVGDTTNGTRVVPGDSVIFGEGDRTDN